MNEAENKIKQQIVEKIKGSTNILVTVSRDPSVDELSAALGLTALLNKLDKHSTAIFSGLLPPAINFLEPDKVFENTADSLRDFIIALDKEKADHLRYKIDGDLVKIYITPYRTTITESDLEFSQGDYNIELVLALGVVDQEHLDTTLASQGQILHDVEIMTFSVGESISKLGSVDWHDEIASGYSEMVANLVELLKTDKPLLDKQISTALLTGIVSATDRFSNIHTSSRVMATAAQLMAAGADQQLIATKLQESHEINSLPSASKEDVSVPIVKDPKLTNKVDKAKIEPADVEQPDTPPGVLLVSHDKVDEVEGNKEKEPEPTKVIEPNPEPEKKIVLTPPIPDLPPEPPLGKAKPEIVDEPLLGGILNATSNQAAEDAKRELDEQQNKTILEHSYLEGSDDSLINSASQEKDNLKMVDIFADAPPVENVPPVSGLPLPPPLPDFSTLPPSSTTPNPPTTNAPPLQPEPSDLSTIPPTVPSNSNDPTQFQIPI